MSRPSHSAEGGGAPPSAEGGGAPHSAWLTRRVSVGTVRRGNSVRGCVCGSQHCAWLKAVCSACSAEFGGSECRVCQLLLNDSSTVSG